MRPSIPAEERYFTVEEVNALLPEVEAIMQELDRHMAERREVQELLEDMEAYWGQAVLEPSNPEYQKYLELQSKLQGLDKAVDDCILRIHDLGGHLKSYEHGLVDFYSLRGGRTVFLCWQRGEQKVRYYHEVDAGFSGRRPIAP